MKIYGRFERNESRLKLLSESTIVADPDTLRDLASFLYRCADGIEECGESWEHEYFECQDAASPQLIVFNPYVVEQ